MQFNFKNILTLAGIIFLLFLTFKGTQYYYEQKLEKKDTESHLNKLRADKLEKITEGQYKKLIADSLTKKQLRKVVDSLKIKAENPVVVEKIVVKYKYKETEPEIDVTDSILTFTDYYPQKEDYFIRYKSTINLLAKKSKGEWGFGEQRLALVISQNEDGTYQLDTDFPDYMEITSIDVQSLPLREAKTNNFGLMVGAKVDKELQGQETELQILGGIRYKKLNIIGSLSTDLKYGFGALIEF